MACPWGSDFRILHFQLYTCLSYLHAGTHYDRLWSDGPSTCALACTKSPWALGRRPGHHPNPHRMLVNERCFFLAPTAVELAFLLGYGRSSWTGTWSNNINTLRRLGYRKSTGSTVFLLHSAEEPPNWGRRGGLSQPTAYLDPRDADTPGWKPHVTSLSLLWLLDRTGPPVNPPSTALRRRLRAGVAKST